MCDRCEELEARVEWLEGELGMRVEMAQLNALRMAAGITHGEGAMLMALRSGGGKPMPLWKLVEFIPSVNGSEDRHPKLVHVLICRIRKKLGRDAVDNVWGKGYRISDVGSKRIDAIFGAA